MTRRKINCAVVADTKTTINSSMSALPTQVLLALKTPVGHVNKKIPRFTTENHVRTARPLFIEKTPKKIIKEKLGFGAFGSFEIEEMDTVSTQQLFERKKARIEIHGCNKHGPFIPRSTLHYMRRQTVHIVLINIVWMPYNHP